MTRWYDAETPLTAISTGGEFRFYPVARKIQVSNPKWTDVDGVLHHGKTVTLDIDKLSGDEAVKTVLTAIIEAL